MKCIRCDNENAKVFNEKYIECDHCGNFITMKFSYCEYCEIMWKSINDVVFEDSCVDLKEDVTPDVKDFLKEKLSESQEEINEEESMGSYINKCIKCDSPSSYEVEEGQYKCIKCGFEWEVIVCE